MAHDYIPAKVPLAGRTISIILQMSTCGVLCFCLSTARPDPVCTFAGLHTFSTENTVHQTMDETSINNLA